MSLLSLSPHLSSLFLSLFLGLILCFSLCLSPCLSVYLSVSLLPFLPLSVSYLSPSPPLSLYVYLWNPTLGPNIHINTYECQMFKVIQLVITLYLSCFTYNPATKYHCLIIRDTSIQFLKKKWWKK